MTNIMNIFPLYTPRLKIRLMRLDDLDWYIGTIKKPFFNEFLDDKYRLGIDSAVRKMMTLTILSWEAPLVGCINNVKCLVEYNNTLVGGISVEDTKIFGVYQLAYWVIPSYQNNGIGTEMLASLCVELFQLPNIFELQLTIQKSNIKSIKTACKVGFTYKKSFKSRVGISQIYTLNKPRGW